MDGMVEHHIVVVGNVVDGLSFHGPFDDYDSAMKYGESFTCDDWHVVPLQAPGED